MSTLKEWDVGCSGLLRAAKQLQLEQSLYSITLRVSLRDPLYNVSNHPWDLSTDLNSRVPTTMLTHNPNTVHRSHHVGVLHGVLHPETDDKKSSERSIYAYSTSGNHIMSAWEGGFTPSHMLHHPLGGASYWR